ncbi:unnamed protein product [Moneuplotes crassus]|uniref:Glutathione S-transferase n=1 Tax=Euplotes crassus TaxID=5936 RepID=A0AAD1XN76_EUPCR|nr:unnamed protein product [Moneuplotes crassus]
MSTNELILYTNVLSPYSRTVMGVLALLEIEYKEHIINPFKGEQKTEWYKKINPKMKIPAIKDGDHCMGESIDICKYLVETRKLKTPVWPVDDQEKTDQMEKDLAKIDELGAATGDVAFKCFFAKALGQKLPPPNEKKKYLDVLYRVYDGLEATLKQRRTQFFNSDDHPGLQDYQCYNLFRQVIDIGLAKLDKHPLLQQWVTACGKVPSIAAVNVKLNKEMKKVKFLMKWVLPIMRCLTCKCCC